MDDPTVALIQNFCPPPPKRRKADLDGPCVFGHTHTSSMNPDGAPKWHAIPDLTTWKGAQAGDVICGACYVKMLRNGRDPRKSDEFLPTVHLAPSTDQSCSTDDVHSLSTQPCFSSREDTFCQETMSCTWLYDPNLPEHALFYKVLWPQPAIKCCNRAGCMAQLCKTML